MSTGGLSKARLDRAHDVMAGYVERGEVPGLVTLVSRRGEARVEAIGTKAVGGHDPMRRDTIFRIASLSKPVAAAAARAPGSGRTYVTEITSSSLRRSGSQIWRLPNNAEDHVRTTDIFATVFVWALRIAMPGGVLARGSWVA
jgi:hypothetical protein